MESIDRNSIDKQLSVSPGINSCDNSQSNSSENEEDTFENQKKRIYRHSLYPLLEMIYVHCEQATYFTEKETIKDLDCDIRKFVNQYVLVNRETMNFDDVEINILLLEAIQAIRTHILELEKVDHLCKDFCNRYISALKGKLRSDRILDSTSPYDADVTENQKMKEEVSNSSSNSCSDTDANVATAPALGQIACATAGGIVWRAPFLGRDIYLCAPPGAPTATPVPTYIPPDAAAYAFGLPSLGAQAAHHQSWPPFNLSPIPTFNSQPQQSSLNLKTSVKAEMERDAGILSRMDFPPASRVKKMRIKRGALPKQATAVMRSWLFQHITHPYPTDEEKKKIAADTRLTLLQVNNWFINARRRILQPKPDGLKTLNGDGPVGVAETAYDDECNGGNSDTDGDSYATDGDFEEEYSSDGEQSRSPYEASNPNFTT